MYAIPIIPETLELLTALNGGVQPLQETEPTWFVWRGENGTASICTMDQLLRMKQEWTGIHIHIPK